MAVQKVLLWPNPVLREASAAVDSEYAASQEFRDLVTDMADTLLHYRGVGLSAVQIDVPLRVFVMRTRTGVQTFVNPEMVDFDGDLIEMDEGCLSMPGFYERVKRYPNYVVEALDLETGERRRWDLEGIEAQCAQHEMDHLDGVGPWDKWGRVTKDIVRRKIAKAVKFDPRYKE